MARYCVCMSFSDSLLSFTNSYDSREVVATTMMYTINSNRFITLQSDQIRSDRIGSSSKMHVQLTHTAISGSTKSSLAAMTGCTHGSGSEAMRAPPGVLVLLTAR